MGGGGGGGGGGGWGVHTDSTMASLQAELNPNEHMWDTHEGKFHQRNPPIQIVAELEAALHQEWAHKKQFRGFSLHIDIFFSNTHMTAAYVM